jgi:hypothetical protein
MQGGYDGSAARGIAFTVDIDGDGDLSDEQPVNLTAAANTATNSTVIRSVITDSSGRILGRSGRTPPEGVTWGESNWAGMQIRISQSSPPVFTSAGPFSVQENSSGGTVVGTMSAVDPEGGSVTYSISSESHLFAIHPATGVITLVGGPDHEVSDFHFISVVASDSSGSSAITEIRINVGNVIDANSEYVAAWLGTQGGAAGTGFEADPDYDGIVNAFEMLFGSDPAKAGKSPALASLSTSGVPQLSLDVEVDSLAASLLDFHAEYSDDCKVWTPTGIDPQVLSEDAGRKMLRFASPASSEGRRFMRLRMSE